MSLSIHAFQEVDSVFMSTAYGEIFDSENFMEMSLDTPDKDWCGFCFCGNALETTPLPSHSDINNGKAKYQIV